MDFPSICIPSIEKNITHSQIENAFKKLNIGKINKIVLQRRSKHISAFIFINNWDIHTHKGKKFYKKIIDGEDVNLIYSFPWFWKCRANHDIKELKFNKLQIQTKQQKKEIYHLNKENWNLKCYTRWLAMRRLWNYNPQTI